VARLSPFDLEARTERRGAVTVEEYLRHAEAQVRPFTKADVAQLDRIVAGLIPKLQRYDLPWPEKILLVKTTGAEEFGAAYCRGAAVVLSEATLRRSEDRLEGLLAHELFHVLSNQNEAWRERMYAVVGFTPCPEIAYPPAIADRRLSNPDAPRCDVFARVNHGGKAIEIAPVLYASQRFDPRQQRSLFDYLTFRLMVVEPTGQGDTRRPVLRNGQPWLLKESELPAYHELIGRNTTYIIHPEEVLADNFKLLVTGQHNVPTRRILEGMEEVMRGKKRMKDEG
jgi:hypothetical protein